MDNREYIAHTTERGGLGADLVDHHHDEHGGGLTGADFAEMGKKGGDVHATASTWSGVSSSFLSMVLLTMVMEA